MATAGRYAGILGTAGHIDHGKSTLIKALTGTDPDRLKEEKARGITIELGFAELDLPDGTRLGVVDVPGHEKFIRHMVAGATGVDIALLVVAADDGVMVQTREHLAILRLLGVRQLVVALTKIDLAGPELTELAAADVAALLQDSPYAGAEIIEVSGVTGAGLDELRAALMRATARLKRSASADIVRLPIDRVFTIGGAGTVVTGTLWEGTIATGDKLELAPRGIEVRIRQIQEHGQVVERAGAGQRVALNLAGVTRDEVARGMIVATPGALRALERFNAQFTYLGDPDRPRPLPSGTLVHVHHATSEVQARLLVLQELGQGQGSAPGSAELELTPGQSAFIQLRLLEPLMARESDHFIVRAGDPLYSIGGGVVLDTHPRPRTRLTPDDFELLEALRDGDVGRAVLLAAGRAPAPITSAGLARQLGIARTQVAAALNQTDESAFRRVKLGETTAWLSAQRSDQLLALIERALLAWHQEHPQQTSLAAPALSDLLPASAELSPEALDALLRQLAERGVVTLSGGRIAHSQAAASVHAQLDDLRGQVLARLAAQGLSPESPADLQAALHADRSLLAQALGELCRKNALIRLGGEFYFTPAAINEARHLLTGALQAAAPEGLGAAPLRDALGVSRKYAIPLLEYFDAQGLTVRDGDLRRLK